MASDSGPQTTPAGIIGEAEVQRLYAAGYMVVPIKPTERMVLSGARASSPGGINNARVKWAAMLAAAPRVDGEAAHG